MKNNDWISLGINHDTVTCSLGTASGPRFGVRISKTLWFSEKALHWQAIWRNASGIYPREFPATGYRYFLRCASGKSHSMTEKFACPVVTRVIFQGKPKLEQTMGGPVGGRCFLFLGHVFKFWQTFSGSSSCRMQYLWFFVWWDL